MKNHDHAEAFMWMYYESKDQSFGVWIYNMRDDVTPFVIFFKGIELQHTEWKKDLYRPEYVPKTGDYVFRDLAPNEAVDIINKRIEKHPQYFKEDSSLQETIQNFVDDCLEKHEPALALVNNDLIAVKVTF